MYDDDAYDHTNVNRRDGDKHSVKITVAGALLGGLVVAIIVVFAL
jgi:hypothetical protein